MARDGARRLGEVDEPVDGFRELGCPARTVPQLACDELRIGRARAHDPRQGRGQRTRARAVGVGRIENNEVRRAAERGRGRGEAADEGNVFRSFQQIARGIFGAMHEQVRGRDAGLKGAGSERRIALHAAIGVRDSREISAAELLAIDIAPQQVLDTGAVRSGRSAENSRNRRACVRGRYAAGGGKRVLVGRLLARGDRAHGGVDERNLGGEQVPEQT